MGAICAPRLRHTVRGYVNILHGRPSTPNLLQDPSSNTLQATGGKPEALDQPTIAERDALQKRESGVHETSPMRLRMEAFIKDQQQHIVSELEKLDGTSFRRDSWTRPDGGGGL